MKEYKIIAIKSTVPIGTAKAMRKIINENLKEDIAFDIVSNPEFLREGAAVNDFLHPDRIILGCDSEKALAIMRDIYRPLYLLETPIISTTNETAELIKYAANTMLALRISFMNEVANLCDLVNADVYQVGVALGKDGRIGPKFLHPGPGFGGSCFPKDVHALVHQSEDVGYDFKIAKTVIEVNARQREIVIDKSRNILESFNDKNICILGLSFKPNTDDVREAPAIHIARQLIKENARLKAFDPAAMEQAKQVLNNNRITYCEDAYVACQGADLILICTEWNEFRDLDLKQILQKVRTPNLYDTRNIYNPKTVREIGFNYLSTGRSQ